jgi:hypothetical protein
MLYNNKRIIIEGEINYYNFCFVCKHIICVCIFLVCLFYLFYKHKLLKKKEDFIFYFYALFLKITEIGLFGKRTKPSI